MEPGQRSGPKKSQPGLEPYFVILDLEAVEWIEFAGLLPKLDSGSIHPKPKLFFLISRGLRENRGRDNDTTAFDVHHFEQRYLFEPQFNIQTSRR